MPANISSHHQIQHLKHTHSALQEVENELPNIAGIYFNAFLVQVGTHGRQVDARLAAVGDHGVVVTLSCEELTYYGESF